MEPPAHVFQRLRPAIPTEPGSTHDMEMMPPRKRSRAFLSRPWTACFYTLVLAPVISLLGCASLREVPQGVSPEGMNLISIRRFSAFTYVVSDMYLPEEKKMERRRGAPHLQRLRCPDTRMSITLLTVRETEDVGKYCAAVEGALGQVMGVYRKTAIGINLYLLPPGSGFHKRTASLGLNDATLNLAAPLFADNPRTLGNLVDLVSHESFHLAGYLAGDSRAADEHSAYWMGLCSQLTVLGLVRGDNLPGGIIRTGNEAIAESSEQAFAVRRDVQAYMIDGEIRIDSVGGKAMLETCRNTFPAVDAANTPGH